MEESDDKNDDNNKPKDENKQYINLRFPDLSNLSIPFQTLTMMQQKIAESVAPMFKIVMEIQQSLQPIIEQVGRFASSINWAKLQD
jgi:hypothetical protein